MNHKRQLLRSLCPCRNNDVRDLETWQELLRISLDGSMGERDGAAHAIGTLVQKAHGNDELRNLLMSLEPTLDAVMREPRTARLILGQFKRHGHAPRGAAARGYRRAKSITQIRTPNEVADWLNKHLRLRGSRRVQERSSGVQKLSAWVQHRLQFEPTRKIKDADLLARAQRQIPQLFLQP